MQYLTIVAALAATTSAYKVTIHNNCNKKAYIWSCGDSLGDMETLDAKSSWSEDFYSKEGGSAGPSIYVSDGKSKDDGNIAQLEYFYQSAIDKVWWDISLINGKAFPEIALGSDLQKAPYQACEPVQCSGVGKCAGVYHTHEQLEGTHDCPSSDLVMKLCDSAGEWNGGKPSFSDNQNNDDENNSSEPEPTPTPTPSESNDAPAYTVAPVAAAVEKPKTTPAPEPEAAADAGNSFAQADNKDGEVKVHTAYATKIVTKVVQAGRPAPSGQAAVVGDDGAVHAKREAHVHGHQARAHSRVMRRHSHQD